MLDTFKAQLKAKAKTLGVTNLSNKRIDAYAAVLDKQNPDLATDDDHAEKVDAFLELVDIKQIAAYDDWQVTKGKKDGKPTDKKDPDKKDTATDPAQDAPEGDENTKLLKTLLQKVEKLEAEKVQTSIQQKVTAHEKLKGVPASFLKGKTLPANEDEIDAFAEGLAADYTAFKQELANEGFAQTSKPAGSAGPSKEPVDNKQLDAILDSI